MAMELCGLAFEHPTEMPLALRATGRVTLPMEIDLQVSGPNELAVKVQFGGQSLIRLSCMEGIQHRRILFRHLLRSPFVDFGRPEG